MSDPTPTVLVMVETEVRGASPQAVAVNNPGATGEDGLCETQALLEAARLLLAPATVNAEDADLRALRADMLEEVAARLRDR